MKNLRRIMSVIVVLGALSCTETTLTDKGRVVFEVSSNHQITDMTRSDVSDFTDLPSASDFTVSITGQGYQWEGAISEWDETAQLQAGDYSVTATYGSLFEEGFDKPFFTGNKTFKVVGGESSTVSIPVSLGNAVVKIACTDSFKKYYKDYTFDISRDSAPIVSFPKDETRAAFIDVWKFTISGVLTSETKSYTFSKDYTNLDAATAYTFEFDVNNVGGSSITISFAEGYADTIELGEHELND